MKQKKVLSIIMVISVMALSACGKMQSGSTPSEKPEEAVEESIEQKEDSQQTEPAGEEPAGEEPAEDIVAATDDEGPLPPYHYEGDEPYIESISQFAIENFGSGYDTADVTIPAITILETDESDLGNVKIWGNFWIFNYDRNGQILETKSGGENCGLIVVDGESGLVKDLDLVGDGSDYDKDAKRIFGAKDGLLDKFYSAETQERRDEDRRLQIKAYVESNNLNITAYKDYGWEPVMLDGSTAYNVPESMTNASLADHLKDGGTIRMEAQNDSYTEKGKSYTLDELRDRINKSLTDVWGETNPKQIQGISCAPIDRGGQVTTQFILRIEASDGEGNDPLTIYYDVNELGADYVAANMNENYYRSFATVNKYGVCNNGGSGGAAIHYDGYDMTDPDGTPVRIYMCETDYALTEAMISRYNIPEDYSLSGDYPEDSFVEDGITRYVYSFEPEPAYDTDKMGYADGYDDYLKGLVYVFEKDGKNVYPDDKYMKIYNELGIKVVDQKELDRMIADRLSDLGLTEAMLKQPFDEPSAEPEWTDLI